MALSCCPIISDSVIEFTAADPMVGHTPILYEMLPECGRII